MAQPDAGLVPLLAALPNDISEELVKQGFISAPLVVHSVQLKKELQTDGAIKLQDPDQVFATAHAQKLGIQENTPRYAQLVLFYRKCWDDVMGPASPKQDEVLTTKEPGAEDYGDLDPQYRPCSLYTSDAAAELTRVYTAGHRCRIKT